MIDVNTKWVAVATFTISADQLSSFAREASMAVERSAPMLRGFLEGIVMTNDVHTQLFIISHWTSKEAWSEAQWDEQLARILTGLVEASKGFEFHAYEPITVVRAPH